MELIFDIDGTLWNTTGVVAEAWNYAVKQMALPGTEDVFLTGERLKGEFGKPMDVIAQDLFPRVPLGPREELMQRCCDEEENFLRRETKDLSYEGVVSTIRRLAEKNSLFIVSNCQKGYIELTMQKLGIEAFIQDIECFGNTGLTKGQNIRLVADRNALKAPVYVGDTAGDAAAAKEAGLPFIWAAYGFGEVTDAWRTIRSFPELLKLI